MAATLSPVLLRAGIPLVDEVEALVRGDDFARHAAFNRAFLEAHGPAMRRYGSRWGGDPLRLWSRRWEYPFAADRILRFARQRPEPLRLLDAGSGVTYLPYYLLEQVPQTKLLCCDYDSSYREMFQRINAQRAGAGGTGSAAGGAGVAFLECALQSIPLDDGAVDAICCISVLEHTDRHQQIVDEFARVLRPGGLLVLSFDLSLDGRFALSREAAEALLEAIGNRFDLAPGEALRHELERLGNGQPILSTDYVRRTQPELLPWKYPMLMAMRDLLRGYGWTRGFRSKTICCLDARRRGA